MKMKRALVSSGIIVVAGLACFFVTSGPFDARPSGAEADRASVEEENTTNAEPAVARADRDEPEASSNDERESVKATGPDASSAESIALNSSASVTASVRRVLFEETTTPDKEGHFQRKRVVETDMHYPLIRSVEKLQHDPQTGDENVLDRTSMVADHAVLQLADSLSGSEVEAMEAKHGVEIRKHLRQEGLYLVEFPVDGVDSLMEVTKRLNEEEESVSFAEPDYVVTTLEAPNDPRFVDGSLWGLKNSGQRQGRRGADVGAAPAWSMRTDAEPIIVAVIDTGIRHTHRDLAANMWRNPRETLNGRDDSGSGYIDDIHGVNTINGEGDSMDDHGHGTHVAGTIGAVGDNGEGVVGVAWNVQLMAVKFLGATGGGFTSDAVLSVDYARENGADVMNNSWGGGAFSQALADAIGRSRDAGIIFVAGAGNDGLNNDVVRSYPSGYDFDNIVTVASMNRHGELSNFSNYGLDRVDLMAPGGTTLFGDPPGDGILSTWNTSDTAYNSISGTSMAAPHVAGMFALLKAEFPAEEHQRLISRVLAGATEVPSTADRLPLGRQANLYRPYGRGGLPVVLGSLEDEEFLSGETESLTVEATGEEPLSYTWFKDGAEVPEVSGASLTLNDLSPLDSGVYRVEVANAHGEVSSEATLTHLHDSPEIAETFGTEGLVWITTPEAPWKASEVKDGREAVRTGEIADGEGTKLQTTVEGPGELTFWWRTSSEESYDWMRFSVADEVRANLSGETGWLKRTVAIPHGTHTLSWSYEKDTSVSKGDDAGWVADVVYNQYSPGITSSPESVELLVGDSHTLEAQADGASPLQWHWTRDGDTIPGETSSQLVIEEATLEDAGTYRAIVNNSYGSMASQPAVISVVEEVRAPAMTEQPSSTVSLAGDSVAFSVEFEGTAPFELQWYKDGSALEGRGEATLSFGQVDEDDAGVYTVEVTNRAGTVQSEGAALTVHPARVDFDDWLSRMDVPVDSRGPMNSPAGDGVPNLLKFALGLKPSVSSPGAAVALQMTGEDGAVVVLGDGTESQETYGSLVFERASNTSGVTYHLEASPNMTEWKVVPSVSDVIETISPIRERVQIREVDPVGAEKRRFFRLRIELSE